MSRQLTSKLDRWVRLIVITGMVLGAFGQPTTSYAQPVLSGLAQAETATPTSTPPTETETPTPEQITATPTTDVLQITEVPTDVVGTSTAEPTITVTVTATPQPTGTITTTATPEPSPTPIRTIPPDIIELLPPGLPIIEIKDSAEDGSQTVQIGQTGAALFFANNRIVVVAKPGTFSEDVRLVLKPSLIAKPEPTPIPTVVVPTDQPIEETSVTSDETPVTGESNPSLDYSAEIANSELGTVASPAVEETTPIDEGEVIIPIPATPTPEITFPLDAPAELQAASAGTEIQFSVTAQRVADGKVVDTFDVPAQFIVDLRDLPGVYASSSRYLRYQDAADPVMWHRVSTITHDEVGLISAETNHFSNWSTGDDPGAWKWRWQPPSVSEFSGAATYQYPIEIPPGRGGLTPNVGVSYSSRGLDGLFKSNHEQGMLGLGWSVGNIEISRDNVGMYCCQGDGPRLVLPDSFTLALNSQSYSLTPDTDLSVNPLRYYVQGGPEISVQRVYTDTGDVDPFTDQYNWYWVVKTANGTVYRLGYTADSETRQNCCVIATDSLRPTSGTRWRVDTITDVNGNQIQYTYTKWTKSDTYPWFNINSTPQSGTAYLSTEMAQVLAIQYNFTAQATAGSAYYVYEPVTSTHQSRIEFIDDNTGDTDYRLNRIWVYHLGIKQRKIEFTLSDVDYDAAGQCTQDTLTRVVTAITEKGSDDGALPQTTFTYVKTPHNGSSEWCYAYLEEVNNGFGGKAKFVYSHDGRVSYPDAGYSYFVTQAQTTDGAHGSTYSTIDYTYDAPCYDHSQGLIGTNPTGGLDCTTRDPQVAGTFVRTVGGLTGFNRTTALYKDYGGQPLRQTVTWFGQLGSRLGMPIRQLTVDPLVTINIPNAGFEDGTNNWTSAVTSSAVQTLTTSTTNPHSGRDNLQIDVSGISGLNQNYAESAALSNWATGQRYSVSAFLRSDSADLEMCLSVYGSLTGGGTYETTVACAATTQSWQLVEGNVQLPGNASTLKVLIRARKNGRYFVDDLFIGRILQASESESASYGIGTTSFDKVATTYSTTYAPDGLTQTTRVSNGYNGRGDLMSAMQYGAEVRLLNPSFEQGLAGWYSYCSGSGCTAVVEGYSPSGFFGSTTRLKLAGSAAGGVVQDVSGLTVGASYTARVRVRSVTGAGDFQLWLHNANSTTYCGGSCGNTNVATLTLSPVLSTTWQEVSLTFTAPATGRVRIHLYYPTANSGTIYVDEVSLAKTADVGDERTTVNWYAEDTTGSTWLTSLPFASLVYKGINGHWCNADLMTQSTQYYDGYSTVTDPFGQSATSLTKGQLTMTAKGMVYSCGTANYTTEQYAYDTWGNPKQVTDAGGHSVFTQYDSTLNLYPTSITTTVNSNVLSQTLQYYGVAGVGDQATNYPRGTLKQRQDANGQVTTYTYDEFGRVKTIVRPGDSATYPSVTYTYTTSSYPFALQTDVRETSGCSTCVHSTYEYYDGLGQLLQTRAEMATAGQFTVNKVTYDSLGRAVRTTVPEQAGGSTYVAATGSETASRPVFDSLGRTVAAIAPDGTVSSVGYTDQTLVNADANGHYRINTLDTFGRTIRVDETITTTQTFAESFTSLNTSNWTYSCQGASAGCQSIDSGTLKNIGTGSNWNATVYRAGGDTVSGAGSVAGIRVEFKVASGSSAVLALQSSSNVYRRFGITFDSTRINVQYNNNGTWIYPTDLINPIALNTWYILELRVLPDGQGLIVVTEKDNPAKSSSFVAPMPAGGSYHFQQWVNAGTVWMDNYSEFQPTYQPTRYTYNALDQLTVVTDTLNNTTVISYNVLGQKYEMLDPDMGFWKYGYDVRGNLSWQKDARQQQLCFTYDELNRLTAKHQLLSGSDCATDPKALLASFGYDNAANLGKGQRTSMSDATGTAEWRYDNRGRVISETRTITATVLNTSYTTLMNYDAMDRVITTTYPTGEIVTNTYNAQGLLATVRGLNDGLYVNGLTYDVASRLTNITLNNGLVTTYTYASWNDRGGRLLRIQTGASLLDFNYAYDAVGNIRTITDSANSNQVLTFGYDALDRLTSASTSLVGNGQYTQTWGYNAIGNITTTTLITTSTQTNTYTYTATASGTCSTTQTEKPHAASGMGVNGYSYDCNGNMLTRGENGVTYQQQFNAENQLVVVTDTATALATNFYYDGDGRRVLLTRSDGSKVVYPSGLMEVEYVSGSPTGNIVVDRLDDPASGGTACTASGNDCSLRGAISYANGNSNADVIAIPAGTYTLTRTGTADDNNTNGDLDITNPVTITGAGANVVTINTASGWTERVFHVLSGKTLNLIGVTVTGGNQSGAVGGGVYNQSGTVTISNTTILSNTATDGGGLYSSGTLTLLNSSVLTNTSSGSNGGGGLAQNGSTADLTNVTFSGNRAQAGGGGVYLTSSGTLTITNGTVVSNTADYDANGTGDGGGLRRGSGTLNLRNTIRPLA